MYFKLVRKANAVVLFFILYTYRPLRAFTHLYFRALYHFSHNLEFLKGVQCKALQLIAVCFYRPESGSISNVVFLICCISFSPFAP